MSEDKLYTYFKKALKNQTLHKFDGSITALANATDFSRGYISNIYHGVKKAGYKSQIKIANSLGFELEAFYNLGKALEAGTGIGETEEARYTRLPKVLPAPAASLGCFVSNIESMVDNTFAFRGSWISRIGQEQNLLLMDVAGNSMAPLLSDGDVVMIDISQTSLIPDKIYAVRIEDLIYLRFIDRLPGKIVLKCYNKNYESMPLDTAEINDANFKILGRVVWWAHLD